jgi:ABC-2 type transport system ATP-binding protein
MANSIEISHLSKEYSNHVKALDDVSFSVGSGVYGLLGHNGAGKTTLMKSIVTILQPTGGSIAVCGFDTRQHGDQVRSCIGYLPQELGMYPSLSVFDFVSYIAALKGFHDPGQVKHVLELVDMLQFSKMKISQLSGGMKRRVGIAQALVGDPQVLIVDEPTAGLDPEERVRFRGVLSRFANDGKTILLSTHIIEDVYQLCEKLAVLRKGHLFFHGSTERLMQQVEGKIKIVKLSSEEQLAGLQSKAVLISSTYEHKMLFARIMDEKNSFPEAPATATLEDAYVYCMGGKSHE